MFTVSGCGIDRHLETLETFLAFGFHSGPEISQLRGLLVWPPDVKHVRPRFEQAFQDVVILQVRPLIKLPGSTIRKIKPSRNMLAMPSWPKRPLNFSWKAFWKLPSTKASCFPVRDLAGADPPPVRLVPSTFYSFWCHFRVPANVPVGIQRPASEKDS
jgi:hypothetical protein